MLPRDTVWRYTRLLTTPSCTCTVVATIWCQPLCNLSAACWKSATGCHPIDSIRVLSWHCGPQQRRSGARSDIVVYLNYLAMVKNVLVSPVISWHHCLTLPYPTTLPWTSKWLLLFRPHKKALIDIAIELSVYSGQPVMRECWYVVLQCGRG